VRQSLVRIRSFDRNRKEVEADYIGMVVSGPFSEPDAMDADAPTLKLPAVHRAVLTPKYHGVASVEIMGREVARVGDAKPMVIPAMKRPIPNSPVFLLERDRIEAVLGLSVPGEQKPVRLGLMSGAADVSVHLPANLKSVLPRHLGILGTTGAGKSTTDSGLVARLAAAGNAIVLFDTEGEYAAICGQTDDPVMMTMLEERGLKPFGIDNSHLYVMHGCEPAYPEHPSKKFFKLDFSDLSIHVLMEILELSAAQERRFIDAYDICKIVMDKVQVWPVTRDDQQAALEVDELETGWPKMTLEMILDVISGAIAHCQKSDTFELPAFYFKGHEDEILKVVKERKIEPNKFSWLGLSKKLWKLRRANIFSTNGTSLINVDEMLTAGRVSVVDLSDMDAPYLRKIVIAQILRRIQSRRDVRYRERELALRQSKNAPPFGTGEHLHRRGARIPL
jgi:uncharacterized protein